MAQDLPVISLEMAFGFGPAKTPSEDDWIDVTEFMRPWTDFEMERGRNHELGQAETGQATFALTNRDGRFDPTNDESPYWPNVLPLTPVRLSATYNGTTRKMFTGFVEEWPLDYPEEGLDAVTTITIVDLFEPMNQINLRGGFRDEIESDDDVILFWPFDDADRHRRIWDYSGNEYHGRYEGPARLSEPDILPGGGGTSTRFTTISEARIDEPSSVLRRNGPMTIGFWVELPTSGVTTALVECSSHPRDRAYQVRWNGSSERLEWRQARSHNDQVYTVATPDGSVKGGETVYVEVVRHGHYRIEFRVNGESIHEGTIYTLAGTSREQVFRVGHGAGSKNMSHIVIWRNAQPKGATKRRWKKRLNKLPSQLVKDRVETIVEHLGWDVGLKLDEGVSNLASGSPDGTVLSYLLDAALSEGGFMYIDGDGDIVVQDRHHRIRQDREPKYVFGEGGVFVSDLEALLDLEWHVSSVTVNDVTVEDENMMDRLGVREREFDLPQADDRTAEAIAHWVLIRARNIQSRVEKIVLKPQLDPETIWPIIMDLELSDRVRIQWTPYGGQQQVLDCHVEKITHRTNQPMWETELELSPMDTEEFWQLQHFQRGQIDNPDYVIAP